MKKRPALWLIVFCFLFLTGNLKLRAQQIRLHPVYHNLVLEGGGIRGIAYGGVLKELEDRGMLTDIRRVAGTSAGAMQAMLVALGYTAEDIGKLTYETPIDQFNDGRWIFFGGFHRLVRQYGWYRGNAISRWAGKLIKERSGSDDLTFMQLHRLAGSKGFRDLYITGTNLSRQEAVVFSYESFPDMKIKDAVRISMSVPLYFRAVFMDSAGHIYNHAPKGIATDVMMDGGVISNYPIHVFDQKKYEDSGDTSSTAKVFNRLTLGIRLDTEAQIDYDRRNAGLAPYPIHSFKNYTSAFYTLIIEKLNRDQLLPDDWKRTVSVSTVGFGPRVRKMSEEEKNDLMESGKRATLRFLRDKETN
jgi:NTE family protein